MTDSSTQPSLANAQVTGGGGTEPDPAERPPTATAEPGNTGAGVDLKSENLPDADD